jgi:hypothetical protein
MQDIGFKNTSTFSVEQLITLIAFSLVILCIAYVLRKNSKMVKRFISPLKVNNHSNFEVSIQRLDRVTSLYSIKSAERTFVIFRAPEGVLLLEDKIAVAKDE